MTVPVVKFRVGDAIVTRVFEMALTSLTPEFLYPDWDPFALTDHETWLALGAAPAGRREVGLFVNVWAVELDGRVVLVDTGIGNAKERPFNQLFDHLDTPFLARLDAAGIAPEAVGHVLHTHLHTDHVGWNTRRAGTRWVPTFPNAVHVFPAAERDYYATPAGERRRVVFEDSVLPLIEAGRALAFDDGDAPDLDGFRLLPTPGHSVGHHCVALSARGAEAVFSGDVMHNPVQVHHPHWNSAFCADAAMARASRRLLLEYAAERDAVLFPPHFPETSAGRVSRRGDGFAWRYLDPDVTV